MMRTLGIFFLILIGPVGWIILLFWGLLYDDEEDEKERRHKELIAAIAAASRGPVPAPNDDVRDFVAAMKAAEGKTQ